MNPSSWPLWGSGSHAHTLKSCGARWALLLLVRMGDDVQTQLIAEIKTVEAAIDAEKRVIKHNISKLKDVDGS
jgi:hypothetical protein